MEQCLKDYLGEGLYEHKTLVLFREKFAMFKEQVVEMKNNLPQYDGRDPFINSLISLDVLESTYKKTFTQLSIYSHELASIEEKVNNRIDEIEKEIMEIIGHAQGELDSYKVLQRSISESHTGSRICDQNSINNSFRDLHQALETLNNKVKSIL